MHKQHLTITNRPEIFLECFRSCLYLIYHSRFNIKRTELFKGALSFFTNCSYQDHAELWNDKGTVPLTLDINVRGTV